MHFFIFCLSAIFISLAANGFPHSIDQKFTERPPKKATTLAVIASGLDLQDFSIGNLSLMGSTLLLKNPLVGESQGLSFDFVENQEVSFDVTGEGTHVSKIITAINDRAKIIPIRVINKDHIATSDNVYDAIKYALDKEARIVYLSSIAFAALQENEVYLKEVLTLIKYFQPLVIIPVKKQKYLHPIVQQNHFIWQDHFMTVCATEVHSQGQLALLNSNIDLCLTGEEGFRELHLTSNESYKNFGAEPAAAIITATATLILSYHPHLKPHQVRNILIKSVESSAASAESQPKKSLSLLNMALSLTPVKDFKDIFFF